MDNLYVKILYIYIYIFKYILMINNYMYIYIYCYGKKSLMINIFIIPDKNPVLSLFIFLL